jgi:hypothetical protein
MTIKATLRSLSGFILIAPVIVPLYLAFDILYWQVPSYYHFVMQDSRVKTIYECRPHPVVGALIRQDDPGSQYYRTEDGIPCVCSSLSGCVPVSFVLRNYTWHFVQAAIFIAAAGMLAYVFFKTRRALVAKGLLPIP